MSRILGIKLSFEEHQAIMHMLLLGGAAGRQEALRALIENNKGTSVGDAYERELTSLQNAIQQVVGGTVYQPT